MKYTLYTRTSFGAKFEIFWLKLRLFGKYCFVNDEAGKIARKDISSSFKRLFEKIDHEYIYNREYG